MTPATDQRAAIDRSLSALDEHLNSAPIAAGTADIIFAAASRTLLGRNTTDLVGWIAHWHGDTTATHITLPQLVWASQVPANAGRLCATIDLGHYWRLGAGDEWLLAEAADRAAAVAGPAGRERAQQERRAHQRTP